MYDGCIILGDLKKKANIAIKDLEIICSITEKVY